MKPKRSRKKNEPISCEEDRISSLPDPILHHILSSIDTYTAVRTCALSKRWRHLWTSLHSLHFDSSQFPAQDYSAAPTFHSISSEGLRFSSFVNHVLSLRDEALNLSSFSLISTYDDPGLAERCICYAGCYNVKQLLLYIRSHASNIVLPRCFTNSESLEVLTLDNSYYSISMDQPFCLPALKTLRLEHFDDDPANFITRTVANCPNLETLVLDNLDLCSEDTESQCSKLNITGAQIRKLELCYCRGHNWKCYESEVEVSALRLTSFKLVGSVSPVFSMGSLPCLEDVYVDLCPEGFLADEVKQRMLLNVMNLLGQLREATSVTLSWETLEFLGLGGSSFMVVQKFLLWAAVWLGGLFSANQLLDALGLRQVLLACLHRADCWCYFQGHHMVF
ncbi:hypothetical protein Acr_00g0076350 [Actinidia rufa]|uniref:F-box domain-containing protein n=1 Tax=Actinidia rufa TaxID=165716 RepID=A0A7J0DUR6_9ERIC|nr:hypothetical protein Acr_00g0076350 [Actinidia rufa]